MNADRESFRKIGLTFEEKAFYDILMALRDEYNFEYGENKTVIDAVLQEEYYYTPLLFLAKRKDFSSLFFLQINQMNSKMNILVV